METVLITGVGGPAGRSAAFFFKKKGCVVVGADMREVSPDISSNLDDFFISLPANNPGYSDELIRLIESNRPTLLVPTVTEELVIVAQLKEKILGCGCLVYISLPEAVTIANDKYKTAQFMRANNIGAPKTLVGATPVNDVLTELGLPCIAKPVFGRGGRGVVLYINREELAAEKRDEIVFQEFIPGVEYDVNIFAEEDGAASVCVVLRKTVMKSGEIGNAVETERAVCPEAALLCEAASKKLRLSGPLDFDVRLRSDGTPAILEVNARLGGNSLNAQEVLECLYTKWNKERLRT